VVVELTPWALPVQDEGRLTRELRRNLGFCREHLAAAAAPPVAPLPSYGAAAPALAGGPDSDRRAGQARG